MAPDYYIDFAWLFTLDSNSDDGVERLLALRIALFLNITNGCEVYLLYERNRSRSYLNGNAKNEV